MIGDAELVRSATAGDASSLGTLLERYRPRLLATALRILGYGPQAEDAVHDAFLVALRRIDTVTDPESVRSWLDAVVRNVCRMYLRRPRPAPLAETAVADPIDDPSERLDRLALRDFVWEALGNLSEGLRLAVLLRHFGSFPSYEEISQALGIPVGTVRSRLAEARARLARSLLGSAHPIDEGERRERESWNRFYRDSFSRIYEERDFDPLLGHLSEGAFVFFSKKRFPGRSKLELEISGDIDTGTLTIPRRVLSSGNVSVMECDVINPENDPYRCPPAVTLIFSRTGDRASRVHLFMPPRVNENAARFRHLERNPLKSSE